MLPKLKGNNITAVLNPPRGGFGRKVVKAIRNCRQITKIVYISCNAEAALPNLNHLLLPCSSHRTRPEFKVVDVKVYDMFPMTNHYETVFCMERAQQNNQSENAVD